MAAETEYHEALHELVGRINIRLVGHAGRAMVQYTTDYPPNRLVVMCGCEHLMTVQAWLKHVEQVRDADIPKGR